VRIIALALLALSLFAWWRSHRVTDQFSYVRAIVHASQAAELGWIIESHRGQVRITRAQRFYGIRHPVLVDGPVTGWHHRADAIKTASRWRVGVPQYRNRLEIPGLALATPPPADAAGSRRVIVVGFAWWVPCVLAGVIALLSLIAPARSRRRRRHGLCPTCRYDLRATPVGSRCPECGTLRA
jgi:hypothetical protein